MAQPYGDLCICCGLNDVPGFSLSIGQTDRSRESIIRMHLNRQRLTGEKQLEQERGRRSICAGSLIPKLADRRTITFRMRPRAWIGDAPGLDHGARGYMLNWHEDHPAAGTEKPLRGSLISTFDRMA